MNKEAGFKYSDPGLDQDNAYVELGPNDKRPPRKLPVLKIIISVVVLFFLASLLLVGIFLYFNPDRYEKYFRTAETKFEATINNYPNPLPNACGEEVKICPSGNAVEKEGLSCEFSSCPDSTGNDMTRFWEVDNSDKKFIRIYTNKDLNYTFELAKNWDFIGRDFGFVIFSPNYNCTDSTLISSTGSCQGTIIELNSANTTASNNVENWYNSSENLFIINSDLEPPQSYETIEIAGEKAIRAEIAPKNIYYFFIKDNTVFALRLTSASTVDLTNSLPVMNNILSSFDFIE